jgi:enterobacterial common antigen flippase
MAETGAAQVFKSWIYTATTAGLLSLIGFATSIILARGLGAAGRGELASAMLVVTLSSSMAQFGLGQATIYSARRESKWNVRQFFWISLLVISVLACVLSLCGFYVVGTVTPSLLLPILATTVFYSASAYGTTATQLDPTLSSYNVTRITSSAVLLISVVMLCFAKALTVELTVIGQALAAGLALVVSSVYINRELASRRSEETRYFAHGFGSYIWLGLCYHSNNVVGLVLNNIDKLYFLLLGGTKEFGIYSVAFGTSRLIGSLQEAMSTVIFARFAGLDASTLTMDTLRTFRMTLIPMLLIAAALGLSSPFLFQSLFGRDFSAGALPFTLLLFECVISAAGWILAQQFNANGRPGLVLVRQLIALVPLITALPFIPRYDMAPWLAALLLIGAIIRLFVTMYMYRRFYQVSWQSWFPTRGDLSTARTMIRKFNQTYG